MRTRHRLRPRRELRTFAAVRLIRSETSHARCFNLTSGPHVAAALTVPRPRSNCPCGRIDAPATAGLNRASCVAGPTISELAAEAGVSKSTVNRILAGRGAVQKVTVAQVLTAAERIGYRGTTVIRPQLHRASPERRFGFLMNGRDRLLYRELARYVEMQAGAISELKVATVVRHLDRPDPTETVAALRHLAQSCDTIAVEAIDHPEVTAEIAAIEAQGTPVVAFISNLSSPERSGAIVANEWQLGRTAGRFVSLMAPRSGKVAVLNGDFGYLCQQSEDAAFRGYLQDRCPGLVLLPTMKTNECDTHARAIMLDLLHAHGQALVAVFVTGGGLEGVVQALEDAGRCDLILIGNELTETTRAALGRETVNAILKHPVRRMIDEALDVMVRLTGPTSPPKPILRELPFEILLPENC
ncbi:LacI family DNA-binding transcriptional regulator [Paracoccus indicus]|uniref:LacI family DNA-binding transcriptional regulator n=1 Tax=Paracoccus indicus TaxID=2079229 RepID=UPI000D3B5AB5|nr:LacI family DNA-binding transcriptional regulator [Paracoccus indicus]